VGVLSIKACAQREQDKQEVGSALHKKRLVNVVG
jgi:hypothetical protein